MVIDVVNMRKDFGAVFNFILKKPVSSTCILFQSTRWVGCLWLSLKTVCVCLWWSVLPKRIWVTVGIECYCWDLLKFWDRDALWVSESGTRKWGKNCHFDVNTARYPSLVEMGSLSSFLVATVPVSNQTIRWQYGEVPLGGAYRSVLSQYYLSSGGLETIAAFS